MRVRLEVWPELVHPAEAAGLAGAREEAFGSNGAPFPGPVLADVPPQHLVQTPIRNSVGRNSGENSPYRSEEQYCFSIALKLI